MHPHGEEVLKQMPQEIRNLLSKFDLESCIVIYAVCPACDCTFLNFPMALIHPLILQLAPMYHTQALTSVVNNYYMAPLITTIVTMS